MKYKVTIDLGYSVLLAQGDTLLDAFNKLKFEDVPKVLKSTLTATKGDKTISKVLNMKKTRLFSINPITRATWAKLMDQAL